MELFLTVCVVTMCVMIILFIGIFIGLFMLVREANDIVYYLKEISYTQKEKVIMGKFKKRVREGKEELFEEDE